MNKKLISIILIVVALIVTVIGYIILPDRVIVQIGADGNPSNVATALIGYVIASLLFTLFWFLRYISSFKACLLAESLIA